VDQELLRILLLICVNQVTNVQLVRHNKCRAHQVTIIQALELRKQHAQYALLAPSVSFITLYLVARPLNKLRAQ